MFLWYQNCALFKRDDYDDNITIHYEVATYAAVAYVGVAFEGYLGRFK